MEDSSLSLLAADDADPLWQLSSRSERDQTYCPSLLSSPPVIPPESRRRKSSSSTPEKDNEELRLVLRSKCHQLHRLCCEGHGLQFNSRISPSPSRTTRRTRRSGARRNSGELEDTTTFSIKSSSVINSCEDTPPPAAALRVTAAAEENNRGKPADMDSSRGERRRSPRLSASSSRPPAMATSTPLTPVAEERRAMSPSTPASTLSNASSLSSKGSPRLQFFEGRGWIRAPRTGYTYVQSPTYREDWTPDRDDVPMPHMARLPLDAYGIDSSRRRLFADFSDDEGIEEELPVSASRFLNYGARIRDSDERVTEHSFLTALYLILARFIAWMSRLVVSATSAASRICRQLLVTTRRATSNTTVTLLNSPRNIAWTIIEEIVVIRRKVFRFVSKYTTILASALKSSPKEDTEEEEELPQEEEDLAREEPTVYKAVQHPYESRPPVSLAERVKLFFTSLFSKETSRSQKSRRSQRSQRPRKEPTWFDYLPASWRGHDEEGVPLWVWLAILAIPVILVLSSLMPEYGALVLKPLKGALGALGSAVILLLNLPLTFAKVLWSLGLDLLWFLSQLGLSLVKNTWSLLISVLLIAYGIVAQISSQLVQLFESGSTLVLSGTGSFLDRGFEGAKWVSKWFLDEGWLYALSLLPLAFVTIFKERVAEVFSSKEMIVIPLEDEELSDDELIDEKQADSLREKIAAMLSGIFQSKPRPKKKVRKPRKRHTWQDYLPASWRDHDEEGVPLWLWIALVMLPLALIFSNLLPQYYKMVVQTGTDLLKALGAGVYAALTIPVQVAIIGANSTMTVGSDLVRSGSNVFSSSYENVLALASLILSIPVMFGGSILYAGTRIGILVLDLLKVLGSAFYALVGIPVQIVRVGTNNTLTLGNEVVRVGSNVVSYGFENMISLASLVIFLPIAAGGWILSSVIGLGNAATESIRSFLGIIMSGLKSSISYLSGVAPDWKTTLAIFLPLFLLLRFKDRLKNAVGKVNESVEQKSVSEMEISDDDEELLDADEDDQEPELQSRVADFVRGLFSFLPWVQSERGRKSARRKPRKAHTWLDFLPASWRDHDEEGVPLWLWAVIALLPLALILSVFVPGFAHAIADGCVMAFQGLFGLTSDIALFALQATNGVLTWSFDAVKTVLYLPVIASEALFDFIGAGASQLWTGLGFGLRALSNLTAKGAELATVSLFEAWNLVWHLRWWLLGVFLITLALKMAKDLYQSYDDEDPDDEPIVTRSRARKSQEAPRHRSRKRHTWLDFLPASWRSGLPLWLWGAFVLVPFCLVLFLLAVPEYSVTPGNIWSHLATSGHTIWSSLGEALLAAWMLSYRILMVPFHILRSVVQSGSATIGTSSHHFVDLAKASSEVALYVSSAPMLMAEYLWDFLVGGLLLLGSLIAGFFGVAWSGIVALFSGFVGFFGQGVYSATELFKGFFGTVNSMATSVVDVVWATPSTLFLLGKSALSTALVPLSMAATTLSPVAHWIGSWGWMMLLLLVLIPFAFSLAAKCWDKFKETREEMEAAQGYDSAEEWEAEPEVQAEHREGLQAPNYNLSDYLPAFWRPTKRAGSTKRTRSRRKTGTWQGFLPAAWRDHDDEGLPMWMWFLLALLPLALIMATLLPGYSAQVVGAIYEASSVSFEVALQVVALPFQAITVGLDAVGSVATNATSLGLAGVGKLVNSSLEFGQDVGVTLSDLLVDSASYLFDGATTVLILPLKAGQFVLENGSASIVEGAEYMSNFLESMWTAMSSGLGWVATVPVQQTEEVLSELGKGSLEIANSTKRTLEAVSSAIGDAGHGAVDKGYEVTVDTLGSISDGFSGVASSALEVANSTGDGLYQVAAWGFEVISIPFVGIWNGSIYASQNFLLHLQNGFAWTFNGVMGLGSLIWQFAASFGQLIWSILAWFGSLFLVGSRGAPLQWEQVDNDQVLEMVMRSQRFKELVADLTHDEVDKLRSEVDQKLSAFRAEFAHELSGKDSLQFQEALEDITDSLEARLSKVEETGLGYKKCCKSEAELAELIQREIESAWRHNATVLRDWMGDKFGTKVDLEVKKEELVKAIVERVTANFTKPEYQENDLLAAPSTLEVEKMIRTALIRYDADKTGSFDYALETSGGSVISTRCTETFYSRNSAWTLFGIPIWRQSNNPRTAIQPGVLPGECWAFKGSRGFLLVGLSVPVVPARFSVEHIPRSMSPSGVIDSAPREFAVLGLRRELDPKPVELGRYVYDADGDPLQTFDVDNKENVEEFEMVELDILSNHGNLEYTCLYRFRVHGRNK